MNLQKKLANLLASTKRKRPYYCEVEYLETTNQQTDSSSTNEAAYIDTGIIPNDNTRIECRMQFTTLISGQNKEALNGTTGSQSAPRFAWGFASISPYKNFYCGLGAQNLITSVTRDTNVHTFVLDAKNKTCSIDDTTESFTSSGSVDSTRSIYLFARHGTGSYANKPCNVKIYRYRNWNNDQLVQDLIPVLDWNMTPCMYDKITGQLFYNQGIGDFSYGREIHRTRYLESTGTQYIDMGFKPNQDTRITADFEYTQEPNNKGFIFGAGFSATDTAFEFYVWGSAWNSPYNNTNIQIASDLSSLVGQKFHLDKNKNVLNVIYEDGTNKNSSTTYATFEITRTLWLFAINRGSTTFLSDCVKLYNCQIYDNNKLIYNLIPAIDENGVGFMFDRVTHTIYDNAGTGAFAYPPIELEYIESDGTAYINTGYTPSGSTETEITTMLKDQTYSRFMFGCRISNSQNTYACLAHNSNRIGYRVGTGGYVYSNGYNELNTKHTYKIANGVLYRDNEVVDNACEGATTSPNCPLALLTINTNSVLDTSQSFIGNLYSCTIKENNAFVHKFIPAFKDGKAGVYDKVSKTFFESASTNNFIAGKIKEAV